VGRREFGIGGGVFRVGGGTISIGGWDIQPGRRIWARHGSELNQDGVGILKEVRGVGTGLPPIGSVGSSRTWGPPNSGGHDAPPLPVGGSPNRTARESHRGGFRFHHGSTMSRRRRSRTRSYSHRHARSRSRARTQLRSHSRPRLHSRDRHRHRHDHHHHSSRR
jgi:hypothetical protein